MAMQGGTAAFHQKVSRMLSKQGKKPVLKPNRPLSLKDEVGNRKIKSGAATCVGEMTTLMACWKQSDFVNALCSTEMQSFYTCVEKAQAAMKRKSQQTGPEEGRMNPKQATTLLKRFPNLRTEI